MVFQTYALYPHMTVRENLAFGLRMRGAERGSDRSERVTEAAEPLGLEPVLDRKPAQLSGGQRQRVALGRAIVREPKVFLFDEPLSNLDAKLRVETRAELARLHRRLGATIVYVTHDQEEAMTLGARVAVMRDGFLQQVAPPMELYRRPANRFVAGFVGSPGDELPAGRHRRARHGRRRVHARDPAPRSDDRAARDGRSSTPGWMWSSRRGSELLVYLRWGADAGDAELRVVAPPEPAIEPERFVGRGIRPGPAALVRGGERKAGRVDLAASLQGATRGSFARTYCTTRFVVFHSCTSELVPYRVGIRCPSLIS